MNIIPSVSSSQPLGLLPAAISEVENNLSSQERVDRQVRHLADELRGYISSPFKCLYEPAKFLLTPYNLTHAQPNQSRMLKYCTDIQSSISAMEANPNLEAFADLPDKGQTWFEILMQWHFAGNPTEQYSNVQLGLNDRGCIGQNPVYAAVFDKLRECNGARTVENYCDFACWLALLDVPGTFPDEEVNTLVQPWFLTMRPEFCENTTPDMARTREGFDPNNCTHYASKCIDLSLKQQNAFSNRNINMQPAMLSAVLRHSPENFRYEVIKRWLTWEKEPYISARKRIFDQNYHPLCTFLDEYYPWNTLVMPVTELMPESLSLHKSADFATEPEPSVTQFSQTESRTYVTAQKKLTANLQPPIGKKAKVENPNLPKENGQFRTCFNSAFGRTLKTPAVDGQNLFLKIQSEKESEEIFLRTFQRLQTVHRKKNELELESKTVTPLKVTKLNNTKAFLQGTRLSSEEIESVIKRTKPHSKVSSQNPLDIVDGKEAGINCVGKSLGRVVTNASPYIHHSLQRFHSYLSGQDLQIHLPRDIPKRAVAPAENELLYSRLAMLFTCPEDKPYDEYNYDVSNTNEAREGLLKYAADYGRLWNCGLLGPTSINAFHESKIGRMHTPISPYIERYCEGSLERWNGQATQFPNVGGTLGMRDMGDIQFPDEIKGEVDQVQKRDDRDPLINQKVRLNELARTAQGIVLLYARRFQAGFDHKNPDTVAEIQKEIGQLLTSLFSQAAPLSKENCLTYMEQDGLLAQCAREVSYWTAKDVPYVKDLRNAEINRDVYPHLPEKMQGAVLAVDDNKFLTDKGFHNPDRDIGDECQLGAGSGRNPLIALNALIVKMLSHCVIAMKSTHAKDNEGMDYV